VNHVNLLWQHDHGIIFIPWQWLGGAGGKGGRNGRKALPQISISEGLLSFKRKFVMAFKMLLSWK